MRSALRIEILAAGGVVLALASIPSAGFSHAATGARRSPGSSTDCRVQSVVFEGWKAQQLTNEWLQLVIVPQLGGRLMQVTFAGHPYLFVNPKFRGKYFPPNEGGAGGTWFNYGGDKLWPLPEGTQDDQHWPGPVADALDDGDYSFTVLSEGEQCRVRLEGPPDVRTGLQYTREISLSAGAPQISFHATMKNISHRPIRWSIQTVTQYDTADARDSATYNRDFWAFTPVSPKSSYLDGYHVRSGLADDPSYSVKNNLFTLRWLYLQGEVWIDSLGDWAAIVDGTSRFAMIERFTFHDRAEYPGKASVIFYKNGPTVELDEHGALVIRTNEDDAPFYMEAELNSPMVRLEPNDTYSFDTDWFPTRIGSNFISANQVGVTAEPLSTSITADGVRLAGSFGVFFPGRLVAHLLGSGEEELAQVPLQEVNPSEPAIINQTIKPSAAVQRISIHLIDRRSKDRGILAEARIHNPAGGP